MSLDDVPLADMAEEIAEKYSLSSVLIVVVDRTDKLVQMSYGYDGSSYELSGAASRFCRQVTEGLSPLAVEDEELE